MSKPDSDDDVTPRWQAIEDRHARVEARYRYDRSTGSPCACGSDGCRGGDYRSTLEYVSANQHQLAAEYLDDWRANHVRGESLRDSVRRFERWRFGAELEDSAHEMLKFAVLWRSRPGDPRFRKLGPPPNEMGMRTPVATETIVSDLAKRATWPTMPPSQQEQDDESL